MDNRNKILILLTSIFFAGCCYNFEKEIEKMIGFSVSGKIKYETKTEQWDGFQGNGFRVIVYKIKDLNYFIQHIKVDKFNEVDFNNPNNPFAKSEILPFVINGKGFYVSVYTDQKYELVIIDLTNQKLIYHYVFM
jgi:hypothetical protein